MPTPTNTSSKPGSPVNVHADGDTVRRSVTIRRPIAEVQREWATAGIAGTVEITAAPGDRGAEVRVTAPKEQQSALKEIVGAFMSDDPGASLSTQLKKFKARLETGEVPTTHGQPSGRESQSN